MADSAQVIAELAREAQLRQLGALDSLDTKAATLVGFAGVVLGLFFSAPIATDHWSHGMTGGAATTALAILVLTLSLLPRKYGANPNTLTLATGFMNRPAMDTHQAVAESVNRAIVFNANRQQWKARYVRAGALLLLVGLLVMATSLIYTVETVETPNTSTTR